MSGRPMGKNEPLETALILLGPALVVNSLYPGQEEQTMRETQVQSESSCLPLLHGPYE